MVVVVVVQSRNPGKEEKQQLIHNQDLPAKSVKRSYFKDSILLLALKP